MHKTFKVRMMAFCTEVGEKPVIREVNVDWSDLPDRSIASDPEDILGMIYEYGQNDFQPKEMPSVSAGDVIEMEDNLYLVAGLGFKKMSPEQFAVYEKIDRMDRSLFAYRVNNDKETQT